MKFIRTNGPSGEFITLANDQWVGQSLRLYGEWSYGEIDLFTQIVKPDSNVVEVGANIGSHTVFLARDLCPKGRVYAFEPRRLIFQVLCTNLILNDVTNVEAYQLAVGEEANSFREGSIPLEDPINAGSFSLGALAGDSELIRLASLDSMLDNIRKTALLKIDVEGQELEVLKGSQALIERDRPVIYLENDRLDKSEELLRHIDELGYQAYWHVVPLCRKDNFLRSTVNAFPKVSSFNNVCFPSGSGMALKGAEPITDFTSHPLRK